MGNSKARYLWILLVTALIIGSTSNISFAETLITIDGLTYYVKDDEAMVVGREATKTDIIIPEKITVGTEIYPVTGISFAAFMLSPDIESIEIPGS